MVTVKFDARFHASPESPWFDETFDDQCSNVSLPNAVSVAPPSKTIQITRQLGDDASAWVRLDLQCPSVIRQVKIALDTHSTSNDSLLTHADKTSLPWDALRHYEIQIGNRAEVDQNPTYVQYVPSDESRPPCKDCQSELISVDEDLLMWLQFDDPTFIGKDSSNYRTDARIMTQVLSTDDCAHDTVVAYPIPATQVPSVFGPTLFASVVLDRAHYLAMGSLELRPNSDFAAPKN